VKNLREVRKNKGLTQIEVAVRVGVSLTAYQLWERGASEPSPDNLKKLEEVLGKVE
jgi:transcriptional regulator with XRE-family HTH domain